MVVVLVLWRLSLSDTVLFQIHLENKCLLANRLSNVEEKSWMRMPLVQADNFRPVRKAH